MGAHPSEMPMARRRSKSRRSSKSRGRRRNPVGQLRDGSMISVDGTSVTITNKYGESYEYDDVSSSTLRALISAKNFAAAQRACNKSGVLRSINPKRGKRKAKSHRGGRRKSRRPSSRSRRWLTAFRENPKRRGRPGKPWHVSEHGRSGKGYRSRKWRKGNRVFRKSRTGSKGPRTWKKSPRRARR